MSPTQVLQQPEEEKKKYSRVREADSKLFTLCLYQNLSHKYHITFYPVCVPSPKRVSLAAFDFERKFRTRHSRIYGELKKNNF